MSQYRCTKCGFDQCTQALRVVQVVVGWPAASMTCIAPTTMCRQCGYNQAMIQSTIGDFVGPIPDHLQQRPQPVEVQKLEPGTEVAGSAE